MSDNFLVDIPVVDIAESWKLTRLDLGNNRLTRFYDELMPLIQLKNDTEVIMGGNPIDCDCRLRPLQFWMNSKPKANATWMNVICAEPPNLVGQSVPLIPDDALSCSRGDDSMDKSKYNIFTDIVFREVFG